MRRHHVGHVRTGMEQRGAAIGKGPCERAQFGVQGSRRALRPIGIGVPHSGRGLCAGGMRGSVIGIRRSAVGMRGASRRRDGPSDQKPGRQRSEFTCACEQRGCGDRNEGGSHRQWPCQQPETPRPVFSPRNRLMKEDLFWTAAPPFRVVEPLPRTSASLARRT